MDKWESLVDKLIRESMERGEFKDLSGEGEPIDLSENPFEAPELRTAHRLLRNAGFAPAWIEERKDIEATFTRAKTILTRASYLYSHEIPHGAQWQRAVREFRETVAELNQRIRIYNLKAPAAGFQRKLIDAESLISDLEAGS
jgi:DnaJ homolog subfamily C member 28